MLYLCGLGIALLHSVLTYHLCVVSLLHSPLLHDCVTKLENRSIQDLYNKQRCQHAAFCVSFVDMQRRIGFRSVGMFVAAEIFKSLRPCG